MNPREIKAALMLKGVTQASIAKKLGITPSLISMVIQGREKTPRVRRAIAEEIGKKVEEIWR